MASGGKSKSKYKDTLKLPNTTFPQKGFAAREPEHLAAWESLNLFEKIAETRVDAPPFVLHDGPPYANHSIHYGHILNKILKDIVVKSKTMMGHRCPYVPGWDTHGLPIELEVARELGKKAREMSPVEIRRACREYALKYVDVQRDEFKRLGILGDWDNPYLTLDATYEVSIVRALAAFARGGFLYRGKKPVYWCPSCATALAEAEIEYDDHTSPSIYVRMPLADDVDLSAVHPNLAGKKMALVIWTTTPWTIPANLAVVGNPSIDYVAVPIADRGEYWLLAKELAKSVLDRANQSVDESEWLPISKDGFTALEGARYHHPFVEDARGENDFRMWFADHATTEAGTGLVHTAPGHGTDDYKVGVAHGLETYAPVNKWGKFTDEVPRWQGKTTKAANPEIVQFLADSGHLINPVGETLVHRYPHCWRCKKPVIYRATDQWFVKIDHAALRERALVEIENTEWIPDWGENRIHGMIANRPDWVLSRQRLWGVPIPAFYCEACDTAHADAEVMEHVAEIFGSSEGGSDAWYLKTPAELLPQGYSCTECGKTEFRAEKAIVDVWFESGASWMAVAARDDDHKAIDLYLEGSDQHRGWFHSSLLIGIGVAGHAPYKTVITHGFVLDETGRAYSKSAIAKAQREGKKIKYIAPESVIATNGAELLRMWVASVEYRNDMPYTQDVLTNLANWSRKLRNTVRYMLGNLADFDPAIHKLEGAELTDLDRYALARLGDVVAQVRAAYEAYEFHIVHRSLVDYVTTDLSPVYLDVIKDRLYNDRADEPRRRAAQAVLHTITKTLAELAAPFLSFTAEEIWQHLPKSPGAAESVHLLELPLGKAIEEGDPLAATFEVLLRYRMLALGELEPFRAQKHRSEDAVLAVTPAPDDLDVLRANEALLADLCIVSQVEIGEPGGGEPWVEIREAAGEKCERCWRYYVEMTAGDELCERCTSAVSEVTKA